MDDDNDDPHWLARSLYFNREDRRILVPKRLGVGRALNLGHPVAWLVLVVIVGVILLTALARTR